MRIRTAHTRTKSQRIMFYGSQDCRRGSPYYLPGHILDCILGPPTRDPSTDDENYVERSGDGLISIVSCNPFIHITYKFFSCLSILPSTYHPLLFYLIFTSTTAFVYFFSGPYCFNAIVLK
jgi:hypothetical protein